MLSVHPARMRQNLFNLTLVLAVLVFVTACVCRSDRENNSSVDSSPSQSDTSTPEPKKDKPVSADQKNKKKDNGDFTVEHVGVKNPRYAEIDRQVKGEKLLEKAADRLNRALILPNDIVLRTQDCNGEVNAFYSPDSESVTVCYELMEHFFKVFRVGGSSEDVSYQKMFDAVRFVFLHEIGHALIDQYKLPITGNEEDAADRCSSYINLEELGPEGVKAVVAAADAFSIESKLGANREKNMADEHLLQEQRFYNSLCMMYGSNPDRYSNFVTDNYLPKERAVRCPAEYQRTVDSWVNLLSPWRKN
jgi:Putative metallopeptidase